MRVLYNNLVESATGLSMTNLNNDSVASYLYDPFLELACVCTASESVISGTWADGMAVSAMAIGYHNADFARLILKDDSGSELFNELIPLEVSDSIYYIDRVQGVYAFEVQLSGGEPIYIGYLSFGEYIEFPRFSVAPSFPLNLRSLSSKSLGGQLSGVFGQRLRGYKVQIPRMDDDDEAALDIYLTAVQTCKPHMVDLYHEAHSKRPPFYGNVVASPDIVKRDESGFYYAVELEYEECR